MFTKLGQDPRDITGEHFLAHLSGLCENNAYKALLDIHAAENFGIEYLEFTAILKNGFFFLSKKKPFCSRKIAIFQKKKSLLRISRSFYFVRYGNQINSSF